MNEETKEVKISVPEGYEVDTEKSTFTNIVFKKKCLSWLESLKQKCHNAYVEGYMMSETLVRNCFKNPLDICIFATKKQAKRAKAYALITQIIKNDDRFGGEITDKEWTDTKVHKYTLCRLGSSLNLDVSCLTYNPISFHTAEQRDLFIKENRQLLNDYFMID